jgi:uncharacterized protein (TIGR02246 family)
MSKLTYGLAFLLVAALSPLNGQTKADEDAVRKLPQLFCAAWEKHDGHQLAQIMADDVDFVTVADVYLHGQADFEKFQVRLLSGRFKDSHIKVLQTTVRFLDPDIAVVHYRWNIYSDKSYDRTARSPRFGMMTMIAQKWSGTWQVVVAQTELRTRHTSRASGHQDSDPGTRFGGHALKSAVA